jgi:hypothetical protein
MEELFAIAVFLYIQNLPAMHDDRLPGPNFSEVKIFGCPSIISTIPGDIRELFSQKFLS